MGDGQKQMGKEEKKKPTIFTHLHFWDYFPNIN